jgi:uncharacterized protein DUF1697
VERYVAFLRGMNLGGRRIKNEQLRSEFEALGMDEVACFRASGNVVFVAEETDETKLAKRIEAGLGEAPGSKAIEASKGKLQIAFLPTAPKVGQRKRALALSSDDDRLAIGGRQLYWLRKAVSRNPSWISTRSLLRSDRSRSGPRARSSRSSSSTSPVDGLPTLGPSIDPRTQLQIGSDRRPQSEDEDCRWGIERQDRYCCQRRDNRAERRRSPPTLAQSCDHVHTPIISATTAAGQPRSKPRAKASFTRWARTSGLSSSETARLAK